MEQWSNKQTSTNNPLFCTICRAEIKFEDGTKRIIEASKENPVAAGDAFGIDGDKQGTELVDISAKNAAADANNPGLNE